MEHRMPKPCLILLISRSGCAYEIPKVSCTRPGSSFFLVQPFHGVDSFREVQEIARSFDAMIGPISAVQNSPKWIYRNTM